MGYDTGGALLGPPQGLIHLAIHQGCQAIAP
jgi:hypothetical protein